MQFASLGVGITISFVLVSSPLKSTLLPDSMLLFFAGHTKGKI